MNDARMFPDAASAAAACGPVDIDVLAERFRRAALAAGAVAGGLAFGGLAVVRWDAPELWEGLTGAAKPLLAVSAVAGVATMVLVATRRFEAARIGAACAVGAIVAGWGIAQRPDILPGELTIADASAGRPTLVALLATAGIGALVLVPSLVWLFRLTLRGELAKREDAGVR